MTSEAEDVFQAKLMVWLTPLIVIVSSLVAGLLYWLVGTQFWGPRGGLLALVCIPAAGAGFYLMTMAPRQLTVSGRSLTLTYPAWRRVLPYESITDVRFVQAQNPNDSQIETIELDCRNGQPLKLRGFDFSAYKALRAAWQRGGGSSAVNG